VQVLGVNLKDAAWFSAVPWAMMAAVGFVAGASSDVLVQRGVSVTTTRKLMQSIGFLGPAVALLGLNAVKNPVVASAWLTAAVGLSAFSQAGFLVNYQEEEYRLTNSHSRSKVELCHTNLNIFIGSRLLSVWQAEWGDLSI
jgi:ABC-type uncharacterized transport system permease subunit